jgi:hypothetical protein
MELIDDKILDCCKSICELYEMEGGGCGGLGHIVFDDGNLEDNNIIWCLKQCENLTENLKDYKIETILKSKEALLKMLKLNYIERFFVYYEYQNYESYKTN